MMCMPWSWCMHYVRPRAADTFSTDIICARLILSDSTDRHAAADGKLSSRSYLANSTDRHESFWRENTCEFMAGRRNCNSIYYAWGTRNEARGWSRMEMVTCVVTCRNQIPSNDKKNVSINKSAIIVISSCDGRYNIRTGGGNFS